MNWANGDLHEFSNLNLSFENDKMDGSDQTVSSRVPLCRRQDHPWFSCEEAVQNLCRRADSERRSPICRPRSYAPGARVDASFTSQALSEQPVMLAWRDTEQAETRPRWRQAAESAMWRPSVRSLCPGTATTCPEAAALVILCDPGVYERTGLCGGSPCKRRADWGTRCWTGTARRSCHRASQAGNVSCGWKTGKSSLRTLPVAP